MTDKEISCLLSPKHGHARYCIIPLSFNTAVVKLLICNTPVLRLTHMPVPPAELGKGVRTGTCSQPLQVLGCSPRKHREPHTEVC